MRVVVFPEPFYEGEKFFEPCRGDWHLPAIELKCQLEEKGHELVSYPCETNTKTDVGLYYGSPLYPCPTLTRSLCVQLEPPIVPNRARFYERMGGLPFNRILTYCKPYVDNKRVFYDVVPHMGYTGPFAPKRDKFICAVSGGGKEFPGVTVDGVKWESLFPARRLAYMGFGKDLDLYGTGWEKDTEMIGAVNYMGPCENKIKTMSEYKYAIVFENVLGLYTSEKYWDGLASGCRMLYRGQLPEYDAKFADYRSWASRIVKHLEDVA